jgi:hypothetical protein
MLETTTEVLLRGKRYRWRQTHKGGKMRMGTGQIGKQRLNCPSYEALSYEKLKLYFHALLQGANSEANMRSL